MPQRHRADDIVDNIIPVSAWVPIAISAMALLVVLVRLVYVGTAREPDEGAAAHIWQLLMALQLPIVAYFAIRWLPRFRAKGLAILLAQIAAILVAAAPVFLLGW